LFPLHPHQLRAGATSWRHRAIRRLRAHRYAKWLALIIQLAGFATPLLLGSITNALIAAILVFSGRYDLPIYIIIAIGLAQTVCVVGRRLLPDRSNL